MKHLIKIDYFRHLDKNNNILYEEKNIKNIIHSKGQEYILRILFDGNSVPDNYYIGLDNRTSLQLSDTLETINAVEPGGNGYVRQAVSSNQFNLNITSDGNYKAESPVVLFKASGGGWGPVKNVFLATTNGSSTDTYAAIPLPDGTGGGTFFNTIVSSIGLSSEVSVASGESISMKISLGLENFELI